MLMGGNEGDTNKLLRAVYPEAAEWFPKPSEGVTWLDVWVFIVGTQL